MKKTVPLLFLGILLTYCGSGGSAIQRSPDTIIMRLENNPTTLNPVSATDAYSSKVFSFLFDSLLDINSNLEPIPAIATSWEWSEKTVDGAKKYILTFHLRGDVYWHDGVKLTAADFVFTYEKIMDPISKAFNKIASYEGMVDSVVAPDDVTLVITYNKPYAPAVLSWGITPLPKHIYEQYTTAEEFHASEYNRHPIGTGPYRIVRWETARIIELERVTNYWRELPAVKKIIYKIVLDDNVALAAFKRGEFDIYEFIAEQYESEKDEPYLTNQYYLLKYQTFGFSQIAWNCAADSIFSDKRMRQAMTYALDRYTITNKIAHGLSRVVSGPFLYGSWAYNNNVAPLPFDMDKAKSLIAECGWADTDNDGILDKGGKRLEFELILGDSVAGRAIALNLQENVAKIGGIVNVRVLEWSALVQRMNEKNFDGVMFSWSLSIDPDPYDIFHSSQITSGLNYGSYSNAIADSLMVEGRMTLDIAKRAEIYHQVHEIMADDQPYTFLMARIANFAIANDLRGVTLAPVGLLNFYPSYFGWHKEVLTEE